jgi:hypothetical protein
MMRPNELLSVSYGFLARQSKRYLASLRKDWHKHFLGLILFLFVAMAFTTVFFKAYVHRDVGSDSSLVRFEGAGWQFQRGAAPVPKDRFGDQVSSVRYLWQGWTAADSMRFYTTSQGSDLLPYDFFLVLRKPGSSELFALTET